jgi:hypothetical protein
MKTSAQGLVGLVFNSFAGLALVLSVILVDRTAQAGPAAEPLDYMIQNVCTDSGGKVLRMSPLDPACTAQRNLRVGELLPYHKHDWPSREDAEREPAGMQRGDSIPLQSSQFGPVALHTFNWGNGPRRFGHYNGVYGDGMSLVAVANGLVGSVMTADHKGGVQLFVNGEFCTGTITMSSLLGWPFAAADLAAHPSGVIYGRIKRVRNLGEPCPIRFAHSITAWYFVDLPLIQAPGVVGTRSLRTLVSEHYSGTDIDYSPNMERMYFTRELGRIRWERWQNFSRDERADDPERVSVIAAQGRCVGGVGPPHHAGNWAMVRCHEWTNIVPSADPKGDSIGPWLSGLIDATHAAPLLQLVGGAR